MSPSRGALATAAGVGVFSPPAVSFLLLSSRLVGCFVSSSRGLSLLAVAACRRAVGAHKDIGGDDRKIQTLQQQYRQYLARMNLLS